MNKKNVSVTFYWEELVWRGEVYLICTTQHFINERNLIAVVADMLDHGIREDEVE